MRSYLRQVPAALRVLLVLTLLLGVLYPLLVTGIAQLPGLRSSADGSRVALGARTVGSARLGQSFTDAAGKPLPQYFQSRPSAGDYDPTASGASNLGPESIVDTPGKPSLLTQVCARSVAIGRAYGVDGSRPYCTTTGVGAVLAVYYAQPGHRGAVTAVVSVNQACPAVPFRTRYRGVPVRCANRLGAYGAAQLVPIRGDAPSRPAVPADAVTASGSGLDPDISPAYARLQEAAVARARGTSVAAIASLVARYRTGRTLGLFGEPRVNVLELNLALDRDYPYRP